MRIDSWMEGETQGSACVAAAGPQQGPIIWFGLPVAGWWTSTANTTTGGSSSCVTCRGMRAGESWRHVQRRWNFFYSRNKKAGRRASRDLHL